MSARKPHDAAGSTGGVPGFPPDPQLEEDLGAEFGLRADAVANELEAVREEAVAMRDVAQRVQAEFDNYRKRMQREQVDAVARAGQRIVEGLLPIIDNLERAIDHATALGTATELLSGVEMVHGQLLELLAREGVEPIDPFGQLFDPTKHQAVQTREDPEVPDHIVVEVFQKGYEMGGRVVRSAMVVVATGGPAPRK